MSTARRASRERDEESEESEEATTPVAQLPSLAEAVESLQKRAGNRAVGGVLARQQAQPAGGGFSPFRSDAPVKPPSLVPSADFHARRQTEVLAKVTAYVQRERESLSKRIRQGVSIAEMLDAIIREVPEAREVALETLTSHVRGLFAPLEIRTHRDGLSQAGVRSEIAAQATLALPSLSGDPKVTPAPAGGYMKIGLSGAAVGVRGGQVEAEAGVGWTGDIALTTRVGRVLFEATLSPPVGDGAPTWEVSLQFPGDEGLVPSLDALPKVFAEAESGLRGAAGDLVQQGPKGARAAASRMGAVKSAVDALSALAATPGGPRLGVKVEGQGPAITVQATLTISF